jgi:hypothetical protein
MRESVSMHSHMIPYQGTPKVYKRFVNNAFLGIAQWPRGLMASAQCVKEALTKRTCLLLAYSRTLKHGSSSMQ